MMRNRLTFIVFIVFVVLIVLASCSTEEPSEERIRPARTKLVTFSDTGSQLRYIGVSQSGQQSDVSFRVAGLIQQLPIAVGNQLQNGQMIAKLDDRDYQLELKKAAAALEEAEATSRHATSQYKRIRALYETESASRNELDAARASYEAEKAAVERAQAAVALSQEQLGYTVLYAPGNHCRVSAIYAEVNENIAAGSPIAMLECGRRLEVEVAIPEVHIAGISEGQSVALRFNALPGETFSGRVTEVGVAARGGATFPVTVVLDEENPGLRAGMAVQVTFTNRNHAGDPVIVVPLEAVGEDREGHFVFLFEEEGTGQGNGFGFARRQPVTIGPIGMEGITILSGIEPGERIITAGIRFLRDGRKVKLYEEE